ncbi:TPA: hypothetical protein ACGD7T_000800 [Serratia marcescens]
MQKALSLSLGEILRPGPVCGVELMGSILSDKPTTIDERRQFAEQNFMSMDFVNWFFDEKKEGCGNAWFIMAAAMWEGWKGQATRNAQPVTLEVIAQFKEWNNGFPVEKFKADYVIGWVLANYYVSPAPAVPEEMPCGGAADEYHDGYQDGWNACRAAMLEPVSLGYKLVPVEPTAKQWAAGVKAMDSGIDKVTLVYKAMLETAPTQGKNNE